MKIVITGALGHIGSRLVRELSSVYAIDEIVLLDNLSTQRYCSLFNLPATGQYRFLEADILTADLSRIFQGATTVVHLAAITDATNSFHNKEDVHKVNFAGTERVARACQEVDCALIFPSTTSDYCFPVVRQKCRRCSRCLWFLLPATCIAQLRMVILFV